MCTYLFSVEPIAYSLAEAAALIIRMGYTKRKYEQCRAEGISRNFNVFPPYNNIRNDFRKLYARPKMSDGSDAMFFSDTEASAPFQQVADWQLGRLLSLESSGQIRDDVVTYHNDGFDIENLIKWGCDGFSNISEWFNVSGGNQNSIFGTVGVSVHLRATKQTANGIVSHELWKNSMVNSWHAIFPYRYAYIKKENQSMHKLLYLHTPQK